VRLEAREIERSGDRALLEFSVTDSGIGIPPDKQVLLFKAFSQADSSTTREYGGTGLGLSIVCALAKLMDGDVGVDSTAGKGSRFWFRVCADALQAGDDSRRTERHGEFERAIVPAQTLSGRILVVEDNPVNRKVVQALLGKMGLEVDSVENGQLALDAITGGLRPDVVLMDVQMPVMDGFTATTRIRQWEKETGQTRLPIVALTAGAFEEDRQQCSACGMDDFLAKPVRMNDLDATLRKWLAREGQAKASRRHESPGSGMVGI